MATPAMVARKDPTMPLFRVGEERQGYVYYPTQFVVNEKPVYRCIKSASGNEDMRLFIFKSLDKHWIAVEALASSCDPVSDGKPKFRTVQLEIDDIDKPNDVQWQWWDEDNLEWKGNMLFHTYDVRPVSHDTGIVLGTAAAGPSSSD